MKICRFLINSVELLILWFIKTFFGILNNVRQIRIKCHCYQIKLNLNFIFLLNCILNSWQIELKLNKLKQIIKFYLKYVSYGLNISLYRNFKRKCLKSFKKLKLNFKEIL